MVCPSLTNFQSCWVSHYFLGIYQYCGVIVLCSRTQSGTTWVLNLPPPPDLSIHKVCHSTTRPMHSTKLLLHLASLEHLFKYHITPIYQMCIHANYPMRKHLLTYAKFAPMQNLTTETLELHWFWPLDMSRLMGKPTICICENKGADQLRGNREADQRLCFRYSDSTDPPLLNSKISSF